MNLGDFVRVHHRRGTLVVQPRLGFGDPARMRSALLATVSAAPAVVGTLTLDSYTRVGDLTAAAEALRAGLTLNGYPLVTHARETTRQVIDGITVPIQVRHGSASPQHIVAALAEAGLHATEGGPVSYCLPYGRTPLAESVRNWAESCRLLVERAPAGSAPHLETFGGSMLGQLCPPSQLVAISVLEALFFRSHGLRSVSLSYAQQTNAQQDREAIAALRLLCAELLSGLDWHIVIYTYMGVYPRTPQGAFDLLGAAARLAAETGSERLIVKTASESMRIPTVAENVDALRHAATVAAGTDPLPPPDDVTGTETYREARLLIEAVLDCHPDLGQALIEAFRRGLLDIPYCLHPDNAGRTRSYIGADGRLGWADTGGLPLAGVTGRRIAPVTSAELMSALTHVQSTYDAAALEGRRPLLEGDRR